jgi:hypothetical protein
MDVVLRIAGFLGVVAFLLSLDATLFRAAVLLCNKLAGGAESPSSVLVPGFWKAMAVSLVSSFNGTVVGILIDLGFVAGGKGVELVAPLIAIPVGLLVKAATISVMLPTRFGRSILLTLCYALLNSFIVGVVTVIAIFVFGYSP